VLLLLLLSWVQMQLLLFAPCMSSCATPLSQLLLLLLRTYQQLLQAACAPRARCDALTSGSTATPTTSTTTPTDILIA
jgi:hypothetical protein